MVKSSIRLAVCLQWAMNHDGGQSACSIWLASTLELQTAQWRTEIAKSPRSSCPHNTKDTKEKLPWIMLETPQIPITHLSQWPYVEWGNLTLKYIGKLCHCNSHLINHRYTQRTEPLRLNGHTVAYANGRVQWDFQGTRLHLALSLRNTLKDTHLLTAIKGFLNYDRSNCDN